MSLTDRADALGTELSYLLERFLVQHAEVPGASVAVTTAPGEVVAVARGVADPATGEPLTPEHVVRLASSTKTYVASTVLVLAGSGALALDAPAVDQAPAPVADVLRAGDGAASITVRQLLQHTSGLVDHTHADEFMRDIGHRRWTALEQLRLGIGQPLLWAPGTRFSYSDTGYVLLGQLVEHATGRPLHRAVRECLGLDELGVPATFWETYEEPPPGVRRAHQFFEGTDTFAWDPSLDLFGGGGLVASPTDQATFWLALFERRVHPHLDEQRSLLVDTTAPDGTPFKAGDAMGCGMFHSTVAGQELWGHGGFWETREYYMPAVHAGLAVCSLHRTDAVDLREALVVPVVDAVARSLA